MVQTKLVWSGEGGDVKVAGEFNNWSPADTSPSAEDNTRIFQADLKPGRYTYKWVVDGNWLVDQSQPTQTDESGNVNNLKIVEETAESTTKTADDDSPAKIENDSPAKTENTNEPGTAQTDANAATATSDASEPEHEPRAVSEETSGEEVSGDSDSWEKVSEGDCADRLSLDKVSLDDASQAQQDKRLAEVIKEGFVLAEAEDGSKSKTIIKIERIFSWSEAFDKAVMDVGATEADKNAYKVYYWDTQDYSLLKEGVWCKQIRDQWMLRRLTASKVQTITSPTEIDSCLNEVLGTKGNLQDLLKDSLTKKIEFEGAVSKWNHEKISIERVQEGDLRTVTLRTEDCMMEGLKKIYALATKLSLQKLKLI